MICKRKADYFVLEKTINSRNIPNYFFNLYRIDSITKKEIIFNIDHIKPKSIGGKMDIFNTQLTCHTCNSKKGNRFDIFDKFKYLKNKYRFFLNKLIK